jgi:hypothetical protein
MIPWSGPVNIPVEDRSYKWSKKILKAALETVRFATIISALREYLH